MKNRSLLLLISFALFAAAALVSCGETEEIAEPDWSTSLIGRWTGEQEGELNGERVVETISVIFYERGVYRWEYTYALKGVKDEEKSYNEDGEFTAMETTILFTPYEGEAKTLTYELTGRSDILLIFSDGEGWIWNFTDVWYPSQSK